MAMMAVAPDLDGIPQRSEAPADADPEWRELLSMETSVLAASWECRGALYTEHIDEFAQAARDFAAANADAINRARSGWRELASEATELGYRGQVGPLER